MLARWRDELISLSLLWVAAAVLAYLFDGHHLDRSFIIYRIAQNLTAGYGFAYNPGEPPLLHAAVSPAYALLLSLASLLSLYPPVREQPIPAALSLALCVLVRPEAILLAAVVTMDFLASSRPFRAC